MPIPVIAQPPLTRAQPNGSPAWLPLIFLACAAAATQIDALIAARVAGRGLSGDLSRLLQFSEAFAHGMGVALILITVAFLDPRGWRVLPRLAACAYGSGLLADACKLFIARWRPKMIEDWSAGAETFVGWLPAFQAEGLPTAWGHALQSFPSGHAATGVGLAVGLSALYPRAWIWFAVLATLAAGQRIATGNHFLSDTLVGAAIGLFVAQRLCGDGPLSRWFSNWETTVSTAPDPESNAP